MMRRASGKMAFLRWVFLLLIWNGFLGVQGFSSLPRIKVEKSIMSRPAATMNKRTSSPSFMTKGGNNDSEDNVEKAVSFFQSSQSIELLALLISAFFVVVVIASGDLLFVQAPEEMKNIPIIDADALLWSEQQATIQKATKVI